jgi:hypothetical protein
VNARRSSWTLCLVAALAGCPTEPDEEDPIVLLDDDDSAAVTDDDDDDSADPVPVAELLQAWVVDREIFSGNPDPLGESHAVGTAVSSPAAVGPWRLVDGTPVPGLGLHPDRADLLEACEEFTSVTLDALPATFDVGPALVLAPSSGDPVALPLGDMHYRLDDGPRLSSAATWTLTDDDSEFSATLQAPTRPIGVLPGPGTISLVSPRNITWTPGGGPVELLLLRFASAVNETAWEAVRCVAEDDGSFILDPTPLAGPNTGSLVFTVSRSVWTDDGSVFTRSSVALATP